VVRDAQTGLERRHLRWRRRARLKAACPGRSRGGLTSKIHVAADRRCRPLAFTLTPGETADSPQFVPVLAKVRVRGPIGRPLTRPDAVRFPLGVLLSRQPRSPRRRADEADAPSRTTPSSTKTATPSNA